MISGVGNQHAAADLKSDPPDLDCCDCCFGGEIRCTSAAGFVWFQLIWEIRCSIFVGACVDRQRTDTLRSAAASDAMRFVFCVLRSSALVFRASCVVRSYFERRPAVGFSNAMPAAAPGVLFCHVRPRAAACVATHARAGASWPVAMRAVFIVVVPRLPLAQAHAATLISLPRRLPVGPDSRVRVPCNPFARRQRLTVGDINNRMQFRNQKLTN